MSSNHLSVSNLLLVILETSAGKVPAPYSRENGDDPSRNVDQVSMRVEDLCRRVGELASRPLSKVMKVSVIRNTYPKF